MAVEHTDGYSGEIAKAASVSTNDPKKANFTLMLRARFKFEPIPGAPPPPGAKRVGPFNVEPFDRWIASTLSGLPTETNVYLVNLQGPPVHVRQLIPGGNSFTAQLVTIEDGRRYEVRLSTNPKLKPGQYNEPLRIATDSPTNPEMTIDLELTVYAKVFAQPSAIVFPAMPATADLSNATWPTITIRKLREGGLKIKSFKSTLPFLTLELLTDSEGQVYRLRPTVDRTKVAAGAYKGKIIVETNDPDVPVLEIPVQCSFN
ncbi:MAG TPA: hypothetical protein VKM94_24190 [Blastocatellia bacterium]|nr:hypothetical protein [Blastocatellia bacterium]